MLSRYQQRENSKERDHTEREQVLSLSKIYFIIKNVYFHFTIFLNSIGAAWNVFKRNQLHLVIHKL